MDVRCLWNAMKGFIHDNTIAFASACNEAQLQDVLELESKQALLIEQQQQNYNQEREKDLLRVKAELNAVHT